MKGKFYLLTLLLCLAATTAVMAGPPKDGDAGLNSIRAVDVSEQDDGTYITIQGSAKATYSVFKLNKPLRLFVDISNSRMDKAVRRAPISVGNGVVGQVAVLEFSDDIQQITRVIVGFDNEATYDVRSEGDKVVVFIDGAARTGSDPLAADSAELERRAKELDRARRALAEKERRLADSEQKAAQLERSLREVKVDEDGRKVLEKALDTERRRAQSLRDELSSREGRLNNLKESVTDLEARLDQESRRAKELEGTVAQLRDRQKGLEKERDSARTRAQSLAKERDSARKQSDDMARQTREARTKADRLEKDLTRAQTDLKKAESARQSALSETARLRDQVASLRNNIDTQDKRAAQLRRELASLDKSSDAFKTKSSELASIEKTLQKDSGSLGRSEKALDASIAKARAVEAEKARARAAADKVEAARRAEIERARKTEEKRLTALETARKAEEKRLAELETARKAEEKRLGALETARKAEEKRLSDLAKSNEAKGVPALDSRLASVRETGDKAEVTLKQQAGSAIVETANTVKAVRFKQKGDVSQIIIELEAPSNFETVPWRSGKAALLLDGVDLPRSLERTLDTQAFGGTVRYVSSYRDDDGSVRVEAHIPSATTEIVRQEGASLIWEFSSIGAGAGVGTPEHAAKPKNPMVTPPRPSGVTAQAAPVGGSSSRARAESQTPPWQRRPTRISRKRLTIDLRGADVQNVLRLIAREGNVNIVSGNRVTGQVTMRLDNVLLSDAFVTILKSLDLGYDQDGEVIRVAPAQDFEEAAKKRRDEIVASFPLEPLEVVLMPINYADAGAVQTLVSSVLSSRGTASVDARTNTLVIKDVAQNLSAAQQLVLSLDTQTPQILIEARIVESNDQFSRQFGIQWGGDFLFAPANGNPTGLVFPSVVGVAGAATDGATPLGGLVGTPNFAVNLPTAIGTGVGGGIGVTLGSLGGAANLALRLTAAETEGQIKIVSAPRILTLDNESATISSGTSIPISVVSAAGVQTVFVEANLQLSVTPHVTQDGNVLLDLNIDKSEPDFANTGAAGDPSIIRRSAQTQLLVGDGDTTVIGGIYAHNTANGVNKVPFFGDIPILGLFFRDYSETENRTELLIFVTPRIVNREAALDTRRLNPIDAPSVPGDPGN